MKRSRLQEAENIQSGAFVERVITHLNPDNIDEMLRWLLFGTQGY